jgi:hypothetical protein
MKNMFLVFFSLFFFTITFAGISTEKQEILELIGTSFAYNGNFAWFELNGEDFGWTREGDRIGDYLIVSVEIGKVKLVRYGKVREVEMVYYESQER